MKNIFVDKPELAAKLERIPQHARKDLREFVGYGIQLHFICCDNDEGLDYAAYTKWITGLNESRACTLLKGDAKVELTEEYSPKGAKVFSVGFPEGDNMYWFALTAEKAKAFRFHGRLYTT